MKSFLYEIIILYRLNPSQTINHDINCKIIQDQNKIINDDTKPSSIFQVHSLNKSSKIILEKSIDKH